MAKRKRQNKRPARKRLVSDEPRHITLPNGKVVTDQVTGKERLDFLVRAVNLWTLARRVLVEPRGVGRRSNSLRDLVIYCEVSYAQTRKEPETSGKAARGLAQQRLAEDWDIRMKSDGAMRAAYLKGKSIAELVRSRYKAQKQELVKLEARYGVRIRYFVELTKP